MKAEQSKCKHRFFMLFSGGKPIRKSQHNSLNDFLTSLLYKFRYFFSKFKHFAQKPLQQTFRIWFGTLVSTIQIYRIP